MTEPQPQQKIGIPERWEARQEARETEQPTGGSSPYVPKFRFGALFAYLTIAVASFGILVGLMIMVDSGILGFSVVASSIVLFLFASILLALYEIADGLRKKGHI